MRRPVIALLLTLAAARAAAQDAPHDLRALARLDELPRLRAAVRTAAVTSADPSGKNDDGFSGAYSFVRKEGDALVIADLTGPGVVTRIWTPTPTDDPVEFWFDGEAAPRLSVPMRELFTGTTAPFLAPLVSSGAGGYVSYLPLPYARSLRILVRGPRVQFHQVNYATFAPGAAIASFDPARAQGTHDAAAALLGATGRDLAALAAPPGARVQRAITRPTLVPGRATPLFTATGGGRIVGVRLAPAGALLASRSTLLRMVWDGAATPAVEVPVADLFGGAWGRPAMTALVAGAARDTAYLWFPMPYDRSARVELVQAADAAPQSVWAEVAHASVPRRADEGRFHATWRRENPTTPGRPFAYLTGAGRGHVVGVILQAQGLGTDGTPFFEGDDRMVADGDTVVKGTGSEDSFNGGWYDIPGRWDARRSFPLSGSLGYSNPLARTGGYRFFLGDAYAWTRRVDFTIEHGEDTDNTVAGDYAAVTLYYASAPTGWTSTPFTSATRRPTYPTRITLNPGWSSPVTFFSTQHATISKGPERDIGRFLSFVGDSTPDFGRHVLSLAVPIPEAGRYRVSIVAVTGPGQGTVQLLRDDQPAGAIADTWAEQRRAGTPATFGDFEFDAGDQVLHFRIAPSRGGGRRAALDLLRVVLERLP